MAPTADDRVRAEDAAALIENRLSALVASVPSQPATPPAQARVWLDDLLGHADTYRDATLAILAFPVAAGELIDIRLAPPSRRGVTQRLTRVCERLSIPCRKDAFQTLGKGNARLDGLDRESWRRLLAWASEAATIEEVTAAFDYFAEGMAALARPLPPMPELITRRLTFQVWRRGVLEDAFEVSANRWQSKVAQAAQTRERADLPRIHVIAAAEAATGADIVHTLIDEGLAADVDVSVLDIRHEIRSVMARLERPSRKVALNILHGYLKNRQPDDALVIEYVAALHEAGLAEDDS